MTFEYSLGDPEKNHGAKTKVIQFPIQLAWAITAHKCQGMTIKPPTKLVADLDSCFSRSPGMAYVMLGRIQNLDQLILRWSYNPQPKADPREEKKRNAVNIKAAKKIQANKDAMVEAAKLRQNALNMGEHMMNDWVNTRGLKITSLNIQGALMSRLADLKRDNAIYRNSDIICLQEIGHLRARPALEGYICTDVGDGHNRGVAIFMKEEIAKKLIKTQKVSMDSYQCIKLSFDAFDLITVYRSSSQPMSNFPELVKTIAQGINVAKPTILCGDVNFDRTVENELTRMLRSKNFRQIVEEPTTYRGYCIDHFYHNFPDNDPEIQYKLHYPYYSDHEAVCVRMSMLASNLYN